MPVVLLAGAQRHRCVLQLLGLPIPLERGGHLVLLFGGRRGTGVDIGVGHSVPGPETPFGRARRSLGHVFAGWCVLLPATCCSSTTLRYTRSVHLAKRAASVSSRRALLFKTRHWRRRGHYFLSANISVAATSIFYVLLRCIDLCVAFPVGVVYLLALNKNAIHSCCTSVGFGVDFGRPCPSWVDAVPGVAGHRRPAYHGAVHPSHHGEAGR